MKISNSKKQLAKIINENGGWRGPSSWAAQDKSYCGRANNVGFYDAKPPAPDCGDTCWGGSSGALVHEFAAGELIPHWYQTILSRDEYFYLYPAPVKVVVEAKPTIEQRAADYRNAENYAERLQQEADAAKADAEAKLAELVAAGKAVGLVLRVAPARKYTGEFYNAALGERPSYGADTWGAICDGCGKRYGLHFGYNCKPEAQDA